MSSNSFLIDWPDISYLATDVKAFGTGLLVILLALSLYEFILPLLGFAKRLGRSGRGRRGGRGGGR